MKPFSDIQPFRDEFAVYSLPASRAIGKEVRNGGALGNTAPALWGETIQSGAMDALLALPQLIPGATYGWTCDYDAPTDTFIYMVCVLASAGTPVPEGFAYRDIPETACAVGLYGENMDKTLDRVKESGFVTNWEPYGWNAELYLPEEESNPPKPSDSPWHWLVPVRRAEEQ